MKREQTAEAAPAASSLRLLRTPPPNSGESFPGYLLRLAEENSYDSLRWIPERAGLKIGPAQGQWADLWRPGPELSRLCEMTGLSEQELRVLQEKLLPDCLIRWKASKVCPACLREGSWHRKVWDLLPFTACPLHRILLIDFCPGCHRALSWARKSVNVCRCGYDWRRIRSPVIGSEEPLATARWALSVWEREDGVGVPSEEAADPALMMWGSALYPTALCALMDAWLHLWRSERMHPAMENALCHQAAVEVSRALDDWPEGLLRFFDQYDETLLWNWQRTWFRHRSSDLSQTQGWMLVARALEEYLEMRLSGRGSSLVWKRFLNQEEAGRFLGRDAVFIDQLAARGRLTSGAGVIGGNVRWIDLHSLRRLRQRIEAMLSESEAAADLGLGLGQFRELARYGVLKPDSGPQIDGYDEMRFGRRTLSAFLRRIADLVSPPREKGEYSVISLSQAANHLEWHGLSFGRFVEAMFDGFLPPMIEHEGPAGGLSRFWLRVDEIDRYIAAQYESDSGPTAPLCTVPALRNVVEWLDRRQDGGGRFYRYHYQPSDAARLGGVLIEILRRHSFESDYAIAKKTTGEEDVEFKA